MVLTQEQIKAMQQVELEILKVFIDICKKLDLKYYVIAGTLLGAVRHQGIIPWDDDIDVGMPRADYERFLEEAAQYLPEHLFLQTYKTDPAYQHVFAKIRNSNTAFIETPIAHQKMNHGMFLDIFPLDYYGPEIETKYVKLRRSLIELRLSYNYRSDGLSRKVRLLRPVSKLFYPTLEKAKEAKNSIFKNPTDEKLTVNYSGIYGKMEIMPTEWYGEGVELDFEDIKVVAPVEYHKYLSQLYGDYMQPPPEEKRISHHLAVAIDPDKPYMEYLKTI